MRVAAAALWLCVLALWGVSDAANPADDIPTFSPPNTTTAKTKVVMDPLVIARIPQRPSPPMMTAPPPTTVPSLSPPPTPTPTPALKSQSFRHNGSHAGNECGADYAFGSDAVSVKDHGTFCAFAPVCAGAVVGNCPGIQPGLRNGSHCALVQHDGRVYGCIVIVNTSN